MSDLSAILPPLPTDGPEADRRHEELVRGRFERQLDSSPNFGTYLGIHSEDGRLADLSRAAVMRELDAERAFLDDIGALDAAAMSPGGAFERDLSEFSARLSIFDAETKRLWERRASATDEVGDGLFLLFARQFAPLPERLRSMASRLEAAPAAIEASKSRIGDRPVRLWNEMELDAAGSLPSLFDEIVSAGSAEFGEDSTDQRRLKSAADGARKALEKYSDWLRELLGRSVDDFALGSEAYDELISLRAFDGLTTDEILEIGQEQLALNHEGRRAAAREVDRDADEAEVLDRIKSSHPETFEQALEAYQEVMFRARDFVAERGLASLPAGETLSVIPTPDYLRRVMPFAAYFQPAKFDADPRGLYIVTPSVDDDPRAMREHNHASISNTSIHEAYPGHHHQLSAAMRHPSVTRLMVDAPEFVEGWGMYCEQMMREEGFDATPQHRVIMYTDAIWRACRIILDIRLHRGEIGVDEAIDFLIEHTGFERPNATAEVHRYTYTPTYQLSYLLGKVMLLRLRDDEKRRLGADFELGRFHDSLLYSGSLPISFHRRLLAGEGGGPTLPEGRS